MISNAYGKKSRHIISDSAHSCVEIEETQETDNTGDEASFVHSVVGLFEAKIESRANVHRGREKGEKSILRLQRYQEHDGSNNRRAIVSARIHEISPSVSQTRDSEVTHFIEGIEETNCVRIHVRTWRHHETDKPEEQRGEHQHGLSLPGRKQSEHCKGDKRQCHITNSEHDPSPKLLWLVCQLGRCRRRRNA